MTRATPWVTLDDCIAVLTKRRDVLANQIESLEALRPKTDDRDVQLVLRYVVLGSMKGVANWANEQGWRLPGAAGNQRQYAAGDIGELLENPPAGVAPELIRLLRGIFSANSSQVARSYN